MIFFQQPKCRSRKSRWLDWFKFEGIQGNKVKKELGIGVQAEQALKLQKRESVLVRRELKRLGKDKAKLNMTITTLALQWKVEPKRTKTRGRETMWKLSH